MASSNAFIPNSFIESHSGESSEFKKGDPRIFTPAKEIHDYFLTKDVTDKSESPEILDALFATVTHDRLDTDEFLRLINKILVFDDHTNELLDKKIHSIYEGIEVIKDKDRMKLLSKKRVDALPKVESAFEDVCEKYWNLKGEIEQFVYDTLPEVAIEMKIYERAGFLPDKTLLFKCVKAIETCINLSNVRIVSLKKIEEFRYSIKCLIDLTNTPENLAKLETKSEKPEIEIVSVKIIKLEKSSGKSKKSACQSEVNTQKSVCRSEHNTPFCKNCGWRTSWLKNFKKRGVYIKDAENSVSTHVWHNNVDSN